MADVDKRNPNALKNPTKTAKRLLKILKNDLEDHLLTIDAYLKGNHPEPYMPDNADAEYHLLAERCVTNHMPLLVNAPAQVLSVDGYRRGRLSASADKAKANPKNRAELPEWQHWEESRLQTRQDAVHRAALAYGHSFTVTEISPLSKRPMTRGLSPLRTTAIFEDPANDDNPIAALHIERWPRGSGDNREPGKAILWDRTWKYEYQFLDDDRWRLVHHEKHRLNGQNPVTRFAAQVDLDGRTVGVIEPFFAIQDRLNQTVFDLLVAQTGASFQTRWATGMAPPLMMRYPEGEDGQPDYDADPIPVLDSNGMPVPMPINIHAKKMLYAENPEVEFGSLPPTPLAPYLDAIEQAIKDLASVSQTPPHYMLGQIANLSADAMRAAESALIRKTNNYKMVFGESWERVFRLALELAGESGYDDMTGNVVWRDLEANSLSQSADALGKLAESLGIPRRGLWHKLPGITQTEIADWEVMLEEEGELATASGLGNRDDDNDVNEPTQEGDEDATNSPANGRSTART